ncbi:MAG TPA: hypothetical protein VNK04_03225 [Gemmataceae bacterium]|nr:hypothetical protein [Gemmataceae bacterium]
MSWKYLVALAILAAAGTAAQAHEKKIMYGRPDRHAPGYVVPPALSLPVIVGHPGLTRPARLHLPCNLERHLERTIRHYYGHCVEDVDVDVDGRRGRVTIEVEVRHPIPRGHLLHLLRSLPELYGYQICLEIECD